MELVRSAWFWSSDSLCCRAAGRQHYEAGRIPEALECLQAAVEKDETATTLTNLGSSLPPCGLFTLLATALILSKLRLGMHVATHARSISIKRKMFKGQSCVFISGLSCSI